MTDLLDVLAERARAALPADVDHATVRIHRERAEVLGVRSGVVEPPDGSDEIGVMVTVWHGGGSGYAATSDIGEAGIAAAVETARAWAARTAGIGVTDRGAFGHPVGTYRSPVLRPFDDTTVAERLTLLHDQIGRAHV